MGAAVCAALQRPYRVGRRDFQISGCCGMTLLVPGDHNVSEALVRADTALYAAKENGRGGAAIYSQEMEALQLRRSRIETALRTPESRQKIDLRYQPICDLATGQLRAFEALARWEDDDLGNVSPAEFIPIAEQIGVISELSDLLLASAAIQANRWSDAVRLSFNVSAVQLCTLGSAESILSIVEKAGMPANRLQVEVTGTALLADFSVARENLRRLRARGVRIVLDDFGAGHASISYLREMQFDGIKIDGSLISCASGIGRNMPLLRGVLDLCASLNLPCVAEHIETGTQLQMLRSLRCRDGQGFVLGRPMGADEAAVAGCLFQFPRQQNHAA